MKPADRVEKLAIDMLAEKQPLTAMVLYTLAGAISAGMTDELAALCSTFAQEKRGELIKMLALEGHPALESETP